MRKLVVITLSLMIIGVAQAASDSTVASLLKTEPQNLESYVGKYPSEMFKAVPSLKGRLRRLLGSDYTFFMNRLQVEMPIEKDGDAIVAQGCMAHSCGLEEALMVVNLADGKLHCAILSAKFGGKYKLFSEDKSHLPPAFTRAMKQH